MRRLHALELAHQPQALSVRLWGILYSGGGFQGLHRVALEPTENSRDGRDAHIGSGCLPQLIIGWKTLKKCIHLTLFLQGENGV